MTIHETYLRLKLLRAAIDAVLPRVADEVDEYRRTVGARTLECSLGTVTPVFPKRAPYISDPDAFLAWVRDHRPDEIVESVRPSFTAAFLDSLTVTQDSVIDSDGCVVEFAATKQPRPHLRPTLTSEAKQAAEETVVAQVEAWKLPEVEQ